MKESVEFLTCISGHVLGWDLVVTYMLGRRRGRLLILRRSSRGCQRTSKGQCTMEDGNGTRDL